MYVCVCVCVCVCVSIQKLLLKCINSYSKFNLFIYIVYIHIVYIHILCHIIHDRIVNLLRNVFQYTAVPLLQIKDCISGVWLKTTSSKERKLKKIHNHEHWTRGWSIIQLNSRYQMKPSAEELKQFLKSTLSHLTFNTESSSSNKRQVLRQNDKCMCFDSPGRCCIFTMSPSQRCGCKQWPALPGPLLCDLWTL